jgi:hypothetical protein
MECRETTKVYSVDEMTLLPTKFLLIRVLFIILRIDVAQNFDASREPVPSCFMKDSVAVLKRKLLP